MLGTIAEVLLLGVHGDFAKVSNLHVAKSLFKKYKIEMSPRLIDDAKLFEECE